MFRCTNILTPNRGRGFRGFHLRLGPSTHTPRTYSHTPTHTHVKINACISLQASARRTRSDRKPPCPLDMMGKQKHTSGEQYAQLCFHSSHTHAKHAPTLRTRRHRHTVKAFSVLCPTYEIKKRNRKINSTNVFFPVHFRFTPPLPRLATCCVSVVWFLRCSAGWLGAVRGRCPVLTSGAQQTRPRLLRPSLPPRSERSLSSEVKR